MQRHCLRSCGIFVFSLIFLHSSIWATLEKCLHNDRELGHAVAEHDHESQTRHQHGDSQDPSLPTIHCTSVMQQVGPAVLPASVELSRSDKGIALHASLLPEAVAAVFGNNLWLEALFKKIITFSLPINLARHLFLSILQI